MNLALLWKNLVFLWRFKYNIEILLIGLVFYIIIGTAGFFTYMQRGNKIDFLSLSNVSYVEVQLKEGYSETIPFKNDKSTIKVFQEKLTLDELDNNILYVKQIQH